MAKIANVKATLKDAADVKAVWEALPDFKMGSISLNDFGAVHDEADVLQKEYAKKDVELSGVKGNRDDKIRQLGDLITRFRSGVRSVYGPDSAVYEQAGGTRNSARKSPTRKAKASAPASNAVAPQA
jgi:hypothetical protein